MKWCLRFQRDNTEESHQKYYPSLTSNDHKNNFMIKLPLWYSAEPRLELVKLIESKRYLHMADTSFAYHCVAANWIFCGRLSAAAFGHPSLLFAFCKDWVYLRGCANTNNCMWCNTMLSQSQSASQTCIWNVSLVPNTRMPWQNLWSL